MRAAVRALGEIGNVAAMSSLYRTAPVGFREQPDFINAVACIETGLEPEELLRQLLAIELSFGRDRRASVPKGPRILDLDLLMVFRSDGEQEGAAVVHDSPTLTLPHPEIACRRFVLQPLAEIAPELRHPALDKSVRELLEKLPGDANQDVVELRND